MIPHRSDPISVFAWRPRLLWTIDKFRMTYTVGGLVWLRRVVLYNTDVGYVAFK